MKDQFLSLLKARLGKLAPIADEQWRGLFDLVEFVTVPAKTILVRQGEAANRIYFVCQGLLKTYYVDPSGREATKGFAPEGEMAAPYVSILMQQPSNLTIVALEDSVLVSFDAKNLDRLYQSHVAWQVFGRKFAEKLLVEKSKREYQMMVFDAEQRYQAFLTEFPAIAARVPQYEIASYLGITPVALSKIRARRRGNNEARQRARIPETLLQVGNTIRLVR